VHRTATIVVALVLALLGTLFDLPGHAVAAAPRPDIVLFYVDDFASYPTRLWDDPSRTPELARFVDAGLGFEHAIASTPLCGPARANLLTGRYGHRSGVTKNDIRPYDQRGTIGPKLAAAGYRTAFIGKHINGLFGRYPDTVRMRKLARGWDRFDVIWASASKYYDWTQYRKGGVRRFGAADDDHSSFQAARRAVQFIRSTGPDKPLFMVVSLVDGHAPITPMRRFEGDGACAGIDGWSGPAYDEGDVSDKPGYVQVRPRLDQPSYDLRHRCEASLTIDWVMGQVRRALVQAGRHFNTLQVVTSDNGFLMGDHRLTAKATPYAVHVPLYMRWPRVLKGQRRRVVEPVSNVDLGPTFCALAGCRMARSNGRDLLPLIKGKRKRLDRSYLYAEMLHSASGYGQSPSARPAWSGVISTLRYDDRLWAFTRYRNGEEELYDLTADPHRLDNLARRPAYKPVLRDMRDFWRRVWKRDDVSWRYRL
jgi:arylsulfatase A-like enzyme